MIQLVEYDQNWPLQFQNESRRILNVTGNALVSIEHIGSTAVTGLVAKPVIDIVGTVKKLEVIASITDPLINLGYKYYGEYGLPERHFFVRHNANEWFHLHVAQKGSAYELKYLIFRDALRGSQELRDEYVKLKRKLAVQFSEDPDAYANAKSELVERTVGTGD